MTACEDIWYQSVDGLKLYAARYRQNNAPFTLLCMHGLTRNSADFEGLIAALHSDFDILAVDQRGRGRSQYDSDPKRYVVPVYATDMFTLLERRGIERTVLVGTSMGGLIAMQMMAMRPDLIAGVILNDIGAEIDGAGLARIQGYVGKSRPVSNWEEATAEAKALNADAFPDYTEADWRRFARRLFQQNEDGVPVLAYDPAIANSTPSGKGGSGNVDMWSFYDSLPDLPTLIIRGALSDILSADCVAEMVRRKRAATAVEVSNRGHAPALDEPDALAAIRTFLASLD
ncbi:MAG: alpha/beta hydrolase [Porticoccaceae bacterium]|nr:alpha/beta hydrolase [Porticoccaceae bacterium]